METSLLTKNCNVLHNFNLTKLMQQQQQQQQK